MCCRKKVKRELDEPNTGITEGEKLNAIIRMFGISVVAAIHISPWSLALALIWGYVIYFRL